MTSPARTSSPEETDFRAQHLLWGHVQLGPNEVAAIHAEYPGRDWGTLIFSWDRTAADIAGQLVSHGDEPFRQVKDWAALLWVAEHCIRGHEPWPGL